MMLARSVAPLIVTLLMAACVPSEAPPSAAAPAPAPDTIMEEPEPAAPEPTLEERWRAPFAVQSSGRVAARAETAPVVLQADVPTDTADVPVTTADTVEAGDTANASAAAPAATAGAEPATQAEQAETRTGGRPPAPASATRTHRVERGDTWFGIARRYDLTSAELSAANPQVDPERIIIGQVVRIPGPDPAPAAEQRTHVVVSGDSLWGISRRYGISVERLREVNRLPDERVRIGQTLIIPSQDE